MKRNIGRLDSIVRIVAGMLLLLASFFTGWYLVAAGMFIILSAFVRWCPVYSIFGYSTYKMKKGKS